MKGYTFRPYGTAIFRIHISELY